MDKPGFNEVRRNVAGVDLAGHANHYVCGPRRDDGTHEVVAFGTTTSDLLSLVRWLKDRNVVSVAMESTSVYWIPLYDLLESSGIEAVLVDTRQVRMVPGKKSDVKDCQWLQRLHSCGLLHGAFRPDERYNAIRVVLRERQNVLAMQTQAIQSIQKSMDQMNIRLHHAVSNVAGKTGMDILRAIVDGERDPAKLAKLRHYTCKKTEEEIAKELTGTWREEHLFNLGIAFRHLEFLQDQLARYEEKVNSMYAALARDSDRPVPPPDDSSEKKEKDRRNREIKRDLTRLTGFDLTRIDGIDAGLACQLVSEIGPNVDRFPTEKKFVSYIGLAPPLGKSAGKNVRTRGKTKNTCRIGQLLRQAASTLSRSKSALGARFRATRSRTSSKIAITDTARTMAKLIYRGMKFGAAYVDEGEAAYEQRRRNKTLRFIQRAIRTLDISFAELGLQAAPCQL